MGNLRVIPEMNFCIPLRLLKIVLKGELSYTRLPGTRA